VEDVTRVRPQIPAPARRQGHRTHCARGHAITGYNARPTGRPDWKTCRACHTSNLWASRNNLFRDDPQVIEHAQRLFERYQERTST